MAANQHIFGHVSAPAPRYLLRLFILQRLFRKYVRGRDKSFLEIGPGMGDVSSYVSSLAPIRKGLVIDQSPKSVEIIQKRLRANANISIRCADIRDEVEGTFDYVLSFEVLEHIEQDIEFMNVVHGKVSPGGCWFISVPAYMKKWQQQDLFSGHVRRYEIAEMKEKLQHAGFDVIELVDYGFPLTTIMRPFRDRYYKEDASRSMLEKTLASGTEKRAFSNGNIWLMLFALSPFIVLQYMFSWLHQGDGLIVVARKVAEDDA